MGELGPAGQTHEPTNIEPKGEIAPSSKPTPEQEQTQKTTAKTDQTFAQTGPSQVGRRRVFVSSAHQHPPSGFLETEEKHLPKFVKGIINRLGKKSENITMGWQRKTQMSQEDVRKLPSDQFSINENMWRSDVNMFDLPLHTVSSNEPLHKAYVALKNAVQKFPDDKDNEKALKAFENDSSWKKIFGKERTPDGQQQIMKVILDARRNPAIFAQIREELAYEKRREEEVAKSPSPSPAPTPKQPPSPGPASVEPQEKPAEKRREWWDKNENILKFFEEAEHIGYALPHGLFTTRTNVERFISHPETKNEKTLQANLAALKKELTGETYVSEKMRNILVAAAEAYLREKCNLPLHR